MSNEAKKLKKRGGSRRKPPVLQVTEFELVNRPKVRANITVSARGSGLCLYLPKNICALWGIQAGHVIVADLQEHYKKT